MGRAGMGSTHHERPRGVTERLQVGEHLVRAPASEARNVLSHHPTRSALGDHARHMGPQARTRAGQPGGPPGKADVLARKAAADDVGAGNLVSAQPGGGEGSDVVVEWDVGPVAAENDAGEAVRFAKRDCAHPGPVQAEADSANAAK